MEPADGHRLQETHTHHSQIVSRELAKEMLKKASVGKSTHFYPVFISHPIPSGISQNPELPGRKKPFLSTWDVGVRASYSSLWCGFVPQGHPVKAR